VQVIVVFVDIVGIDCCTGHCIGCVIIMVVLLLIVLIDVLDCCC